MKCSCGSDTIVKDSREIEEGQWRRRRCNACGMDFTTLEQRCETVRNYRPKQARAKHQIEVVKPPKKTIARPYREKKPKAKPQLELPTHEVQEPSVKPARSRIEDMKLRRELMGDGE